MANPTMSLDTARILQILSRRWWLVLGVPLLALTATFFLSTQQPYVGSFQAPVLIPGDTENPGNAERPELMVLDDVPSLIRSQRFAEMVHDELQTSAPTAALSWNAIQTSLDASRYSRIVRVEATSDDRGEALAIARAAAAVLPEAVNRYSVPKGEPLAQTSIIDDPTVNRRFSSSRWLILTLETVVALAVGIALAALAHALDDRLHTEADVAEVLGVPVLANLRQIKGDQQAPLGPRT